MFIRQSISKALQNSSTTSSLVQQQIRFGHWSHIEPVGLDAIKQLTINFKNDPAPHKILLGEGVYRDDKGKPVILPSVREADRRIFESNMDHEYAPVTGIESFVSASREFLFGSDTSAVKEGRIATVQTISGTGALKIAADFLKKFVRGGTQVFMPNPTWVNHHGIFNTSGFGGLVKEYRYFDKNTNGMDVNGCLEDIRAAPKGSIILLHACAHNPTGVDPTMDTWKKISDVCKERDHIVFFDVAYQGFASGDSVKDAAAVRYFTEQGHNLVACQSYAKNFGLYGERVGAFNVVCGSKQEATAVQSQLGIIIRTQFSNPPLYGARIVSTVFGDAKLKTQWEKDVLMMADRIKTMRNELVQKLKSHGSQKNWNHISDQIGMFAFSGLTPQQVDRMIKEHQIYLTRDGRISISGLNTGNIDRVAKCIHEVTK